MLYLIRLKSETSFFLLKKQKFFFLIDLMILFILVSISKSIILFIQ